VRIVKDREEYRLMSHVRSGIAVTEEILKWKTFWVVGVGGGDRGMI